MERVKGIEPSLKAWEALVLPLNYTRKMFYYYIILPWFCKGFAENNFQKKYPKLQTSGILIWQNYYLSRKFLST